MTKLRIFSFTDNTHRGIVQDKHIKRCPPLCLSTKATEGDLSITTDRRKTLALFIKRSRDLPVKGGPPVHGRRPQCRSLQCKSPLVVQSIISMMMMSRMLIRCCSYPAFFLKSVVWAQHFYNLMCENAFAALHILCNKRKNLLYLQKCRMLWIRDLQTRLYATLQPNRL